MLVQLPSGAPLELTPSSISDAYGVISPFLHKTPILTSSLLNSLSTLNLFFKTEVFQKTGSFKFRGASHAIAQLENPEKGVVTHSSGNHSAALACAAKIHSVKCHVVMVPRTRRSLTYAAGGVKST
jgi:threonine dehydratase